MIVLELNNNMYLHLELTGVTITTPPNGALWYATGDTNVLTDDPNIQSVGDFSARWALTSGNLDIDTLGNTFTGVEVELQTCGSSTCYYQPVTGDEYSLEVKDTASLDGSSSTTTGTGGTSGGSGAGGSYSGTSGVYGLQLFNAQAELIYDSNVVTFNQIGFFMAPADVTTSRTYPAASGLEIITLQILINPLDIDQARFHMI